ncbi:hypothetical protein V8G54_002008 [Vigna mungo]|uniref:NB-ARC domain-containing protein n=1 Tax=Vigna mungo TaxID=3915 RepID=A0AAQ3SCF2_VIGMU
MMECLCGFASAVSRDLVCVALKELRYLRSLNNSFEKVKQKEGNLKVTIDDVQKSVDDDKRKTRETNGNVYKWLQDAISKKDEVNQLLEEARTKKMCCFGYCPNWIWRYRTGKKLAEEVFKLEDLIDKGEKHVSSDRIPKLPSGTLNLLSEKCMNFESRQSAYEQLRDAVKNNDVSMIGLYGMGGCGKTTLAMEVMKLVEAEHLFEKVLFVPVSSSVDVRRIQEKIRSSLQFKFPETETEEMQRAQRLCSFLTEEKNALLILDDVWEKLDFGRIGIPSSQHRKGCKILITTRSEDVCISMDCQRKIYLPILTDEEAWTLFQNKALITEATSDTLKDMGRSISDECKGLPVAIAAVACSLKGKDEEVWRVALNKLRQSKPINIQRGLTDPYKCLQLSYDNLDTKEAKSLFLLCSVFPEDWEIPIEVLTRCAIGLGVVGGAHSYEEARSEVIAAKIKLVSCCLLSDADDEGVKMHDIVRDVAHIIAKNENKMIKCEVEKDVTVEQNSVRYLWCVKFPNDVDCSKLEFLSLRIEMKEFDGIFKRMGMLKVLILYNDGDVKTSLSTSSLKTLTNLRDLIISKCELIDFSFLSGMKNLQSLSLFGCSLPSFPEIQTHVAITLKLLELNRCDIKVKNFEVMKRIPLLEELYIIDIEGEWDANSEDNIEFFKTFSIPETLQRYGIVLGSYNFDHYNDRDIYIDGRTLLLNHFDISNEVIKGLAKKAKHLFVANIHGGAKNVIPDIFQIEGGLDELNKLEIRDSAEIKCLIDTSSLTLFSKLHTLRILEKLYLSDCPRLTSLFTYVVARSLVKLKILKISGCDELKHIFTDEEKAEKGQNEFSTGHPVQIVEKESIVKTLTSLEELFIEDCKSLKDIVTHERINKNQQESIVEDVHDCETDISIFQSLKKLYINECGLLEHIFPVSFVGELNDIDTDDEYGKENMKAIFPNLKELSVYNCFRLKYMFGQYHVTNKDYKEIHIQFSALEILSLSNLPKFVSICSTNTLTVMWPSLKDPKGIQNNLPALQTLNIKHSDVEGIFCLNEHQMIGQQVSLRLEDLGLEYLPEMTYIWVGPNNSLTLQHLTTLYIRDCGKLEVIFPKSVVRCLPELKWLTIKECMELKHIMEEDESNILSIDGGSEVEEIIGCDKETSKNYFALTNLEELEIIECAKLEVIFPKSVVRCLPELKKVTIRDCMELKHIMEEDESNLLSIDGGSEVEEIIGCDKETSKNYFALTNLEELQIIECAKLEVIFPKSVVRCLPELKKVTIRDCMELKHIMEEDESNLLSIDGGSEVEEIIGCDKETSKNYFALTNLEELQIIECAKLEVVFPKSVLKCLPKLKLLKIRKCKELRQIIEGYKNLSNTLSPQPCFPKLEALHVDHCHKLKRLFSGYASNDLPNLHLLAINGANKLEELVGCKEGKIKVELPGLKLLIFMNLENFSQEIELHNLKNCIVYKCPKLSLTSTTTLKKLDQDFPYKVIVISIYEDSTINDSSELTSSQEIEDGGNESIKSSSTGVEDIGIGGVVATHVESGGEDKLELDSKVVEQYDKLNEGKAGTVASQGVQVEEGLNLFHKQEGIDVFPNNNIDISSASADIRTRLGAYKHFVDLDDAQISLLVEAITTYPHLWNASKKFSERFQAWRLKILADMLLFLQKESDYSVIPQREKEFDKLCEEAIEIGFESSWVEEMRQRVVGRDPKLGEDIARRQKDENSKRCSSGDIVEEGDGPKISLEEGSDLVDKEGEIGVLSNHHIVALRNEEAEQEFVAEVFTSEIPRIATSLTNLQTVENPTPSKPLVDTQQTSEPCLMEQKKPLAEIPKSIEQVAVEETIVKKTNTTVSSILSESATSKLDPSITFQSKSDPHNEMIPIEARIIKESEGHRELIQDFGSNDMIPIALGKEGEDNIVLKTLFELENYLKMSLKDIVSSETNTLRLFSTLNFLSNLPFKDITLSDRLKHIIETMHQQFPTILCSFKQRFATTHKLAELEARQNEVAIKISEAENFNDEAQLKEVVLKEEIIRLKEEIKVCEAALSSLNEGKNKCIAETIRYKKELENVRKNKSQMVEDQRKVEQELLKMAYKWSVLCSEYELDRMAARNPS